jgi:hypothetical protein
MKGSTKRFRQIILVATTFFTLLSAIVQAQTSQLAGEWRNADSNSRGITCANDRRRLLDRDVCVAFWKHLIHAISR